jgi:hypothetical protein
MKKLILISIAVFLSSSVIFGQTRSRVFDNFDTSGGVQIVTPTVKPIVETKKTEDKTVSKSKGKTMSVTDGLALNNKVVKTSYSRLTMSAGDSMGGFTTGDNDVDSFIIDSCKRYNIDPLLIYAQMHQESSFKKKATSYKGASGLMQLMPATARRFGVTKIYDPQQNIDAGVKYMRWLLDKFGGDVVLALAGYNAGEGAVMKYGNNVPPYRETREYVRRITGRYTSIRNPNYIRSVKKVTEAQAVKLESKESKSLAVYEPGALTIKTPDGRLRLVNQ